MARPRRVHEIRARENVTQQIRRENFTLTTTPSLGVKENIKEDVRQISRKVRKIDFPNPQKCVVTITGCDPVGAIRTRVESILQQYEVRP